MTEQEQKEAGNPKKQGRYRGTDTAGEAKLVPDTKAKWMA